MPLKPFYVAVCESRFYDDLAPHINAVNLSFPASASSRVLIPTNDLLRRFKNIGIAFPIDEPALCAKAYVDLLRLRYKQDSRHFLDMIEKPILVVGIGREPSAMTWERIAITDVLLAMAAKQGREVQFLGRVLPTRLPRQVD